MNALVVGSAHMDISASAPDDRSGPMHGHRSGDLSVAISGAAYNLGANLTYLGESARIVAPLRKGSMFSRMILLQMHDLGLDTSSMIQDASLPEAGCISQVVGSLPESAIFATPSDRLSLSGLDHMESIEWCDYLVMDNHCSSETVANFGRIAKEMHKLIYYVVASAARARQLLELPVSPDVVFMDLRCAAAIDGSAVPETPSTFNGFSTSVPETLYVIGTDKGGGVVLRNGHKVLTRSADVLGPDSRARRSSANSVLFSTFMRYYSSGHGVREALQSVGRLPLATLGGPKGNLLEKTQASDADGLLFRDSLTGLYTRRFFEEEKSILEDTVSRYGNSLTVALLDIDFFKKVNDTYGHDAGDIVLGAVGKVIASMVRKSDLAFRFGGEEFLIVFPRTGMSMTILVVERIRQAIKELRHTVPDHEPFITTISAGIAELGEKSLMEAIKLADDRLYYSKHNGRDRLTVEM